MEILLLEIGFDLAAELDGQRIALAVDRLADGDADPAFADAILLDVGLFLAVELYADAARQQRLVIIRALGIGRKAVGQLGRRCVCHAGSIPAPADRARKSGAWHWHPPLQESVASGQQQARAGT